MNIVSTGSAAEVLDTYWDGVLPVKPAVIAEHLGIQVFAAPYMQGSGQILREPSGRVVIKYNLSEVAVRQRFTIAHEVGHYCLGHLSGATKLFRDDSQTYMSNTKDPREREANHFAASLLMPARAIEFVLERGLAKTVEDMAGLFQVSQSAMGYRLCNLGYSF